VAIPLVAMVGLLAYVAGTSVNNAINLDRAPNLINATSLPTAKFVALIQNERAAAVVYLFQPTPVNLAAYEAAVKATEADKPAFLTAMDSPGTKSSETPDEEKAITVLIAGLNQMQPLRGAVTNRALSPLQALGGYSAGIQNELKLFLAEADSLTNATAAGQALGLIALVSAREALSQEYALLAGMLAGNRITTADHAAFAEMVAVRQGDLVDAESLLTPANAVLFNAQVNKAEQTQLSGIEGAVSAGAPIAALPVTPAQWSGLGNHLLDEYFTGGVNVANAQLAADHSISQSAWIRVAVTGGIGLVGLLVTIAVTILVGRSIIRRLGGLERTALQLAEVQLPDVVARLRRGENVDVNAEAPALRIGRDEIGRVGQAFDLVRQTAVRAAVEEARLRQGLNDVFRSLARRSQSLLHRQLTLLDQMERRASDPEALDDLFRLDHLTTRMRRHAEGLVILAGAPPGRGWSSPIRMVDVMRGAIAEVEDYARVSVATRSQAALAGSAVADVIHLLAELIENATTLSPPYTSVRVSGDTVANGFAIEVEDRGLGMSPPRLAELNDRLANPPEFNPSDSEQLGLFVVSQLAKRHGIRVTLKASPYGGTAAIVLIPGHLVVTEEAFRAGLPGEPASAAMAQLTANGNHAALAELTAQGGSGLTEAGGLPGLAQTPGVRISGPLRRSQGIIPERFDRGAHAAPPLGQTNGTGGTGSDDLPGRRHDQAEAGLVPNGGPMPDSGGTSAFDVFTPRRHAQGSGETPVPADAGSGSGAPYPGNGSYIASPSYPASGSSPYPAPGSGPVPGAGAAPFSGTGPASFPGTGSAPFRGSGSPSYPGAGPAPYPDQPAPFPGWTLHNTPGAAGGRTAPGPGAPAGPATPMTPVASPRPGQASGPPWELPGETGPLPGPDGSAPGPGDGNGEIKGLPRRIRQASLAPQLRDNPPQRRTTVASAGPASGSMGSPGPTRPPGTTGSPGTTGPPGPSPAEIRQTMSALQRGWQEGRSQRTADPLSAEPWRVPSDAAGTGSPSGPIPAAGPSGPDPAGGRAGDSTPDEEARGSSDGS
jgi:signal transduction histidine kinase